MEKILVVVGTVPEAVEMCPLVQEVRALGEMKVGVCVAGQREMLDTVLEEFGVSPDFDLRLRQEGQAPDDAAPDMRRGLENVLKTYAPDVVFVHGDTDTASATALACHAQSVPLACVEFE